MGKTVHEKRSADEPSPGAGDRADGLAPVAGSDAAAEPVEPLERVRLQAQVARQRVRIAKEELKRARKRVKEAKREAKRARKQAAIARKAWKKARKAQRTDPAPGTAPSRTRARPDKAPRRQDPKGAERGAKRNPGHRRRTAAGARSRRAGGHAPATHSSET